MRRKVWATLGLVLVLVISLFGSVAGQSGSDPLAPTDPEPVVNTQYWSHPVVHLLDAYFGPKLVVDPVASEDTTDLEEPEDGDPTEEVPTDEDPTEDSEEGLPESGLSPIGEEIAAYHADGMGFGVLVKLYAMALNYQEKCGEVVTDPEAPAEPAVVEDGSEDVEDDGNGTDDVCGTPVTVDSLVKEFQSGVGMGALFKKYDKPTMLGVGHVRKAKNAEEAEVPVVAEPAPEDTPVDSQTVEKGGKEPRQPKVRPEKTRPDKAKGPNK